MAKYSHLREKQTAEIMKGRDQGRDVENVYKDGK